MIYIASPYSDQCAALRHTRYEQVAAFTAKQARSGHLVYSPICHWYHIAEAHNLPRGFEWWERQDLHVLSLCSELWVLKLDGWDTSRGVKSEIEFAGSLPIPITYHDYIR